MWCMSFMVHQWIKPCKKQQIMTVLLLIILLLLCGASYKSIDWFEKI